MSDHEPDQIHATCVAQDSNGILIRGPSGSGKSDLALRLIDGGCRLVADDRVDLSSRSGGLIAQPPKALAGLLEVRRLGIVRLPALPDAVVCLVVDLDEEVNAERLPEPVTVELVGISVSLIRIEPFHASAAAKVRLALDLALGRILRIDD